MAIYHLHVKNISRGDGRSVVAAAAYRAGETLPNEMEARESDFSGRGGVVWSEILKPEHAPVWMAERARLWNAVEAAERRKDARLAKEIEFALPRELTPALRTAVVRQMAQLYADRGHVVDIAIHDDGTGHNPHAHLLLSTREITAAGFGKKMREADALAFVTDARANWATILNGMLVVAGAGVAVDHRSHAEAGLAIVPGEHRGPNAAERRARRFSARHQNILGEVERLNTTAALNEPAALLAETFEVRGSREVAPMVENEVGQGSAMASKTDERPELITDQIKDFEQRSIGEPDAAARISEIRERLDEKLVELGVVSRDEIELLKSAEKRLVDWDLPSPGPNHEMLSPQQRDSAEQMMLAEHARELGDAEWWLRCSPARPRQEDLTPKQERDLWWLEREGR